MTTRAYRLPLSGETGWVGKHRPREMRRRDYIARRPVSRIKAYLKTARVRRARFLF